MNTPNKPPVQIYNPPVQQPAPQTPIAQLDELAKAAFLKLLGPYGERTDPAAKADVLADAAWVYARAFMRVRARETYLPRLKPGHPDDEASLSGLWPLVAELAAVDFDAPVNTAEVAGLILRARAMLNRKTVVAAAEAVVDLSSGGDLLGEGGVI